MIYGIILLTELMFRKLELGMYVRAYGYKSRPNYHNTNNIHGHNLPM